MKKWIFILMIAMSACRHDSGGGDSVPDDELPAYDFNFDRETPGGIQIETRGHSIPSDSEIDTWYAETHQCVKDWFILQSRPFDDIEGPPIIIEDNLDSLCENISTQGVYCTNFMIPFVGIQTNSANIANKHVWKHEMEHHILVHNDIEPSSPMNINHTPTALWDCQYN